MKPVYRIELTRQQENRATRIAVWMVVAIAGFLAWYFEGGRIAWTSIAAVAVLNLTRKNWS